MSEDREKKNARARARYDPEKERARRKASYDRDPEAWRARDRARYARDPEKQRIHQRAWDKANPERKRAIKKKWYYANLEQARAIQSAYRKANPDKVRAAARRRYYDLSVEQFDAMVERQNQRCEICSNQFEKTPCVDHDHATGKVRGLLCLACNFMLSNAKDCPDLLMAGIAYLEKYAGQEPRG